MLGLPRVVTNKMISTSYISSVPNKSPMAFVFAQDRLVPSAKNNLVDIVKDIDTRLHFVHLRNTKRDAIGNFYEADHLGGDTDMYAVMKEILLIQQKLQEPIPFRPDHGHVMLDDMNKQTNPGYSCIGRMRGLAELRGLMLGISINY